MLMALGKIIYFHKAENAVKHFADLEPYDGVSFKCPEHSNPADYFMNIISKESIPYDKSNNPEVLAKSLNLRDRRYEGRIDYFEEKYQQSNLFCDIESGEFTKDFGYIDKTTQLARTPWLYQFNLLLQRNFLNIFRLP